MICFSSTTALTTVSTTIPRSSLNLSPILLEIPQNNPLLLISAYMLVSNLAYLARRATLRKTTMWGIFQIRTVRERGVSWPMFAVFLAAWQLFVAFFPFTESFARLCGYASFFYSYSNANGGGYILEPLWIQQAPASKRTKEQLRLDWHRFKYNVGDVGRDGFRHPPTLQRNLPHIDLPRKGLKHWPWRRKYYSKMKYIHHSSKVLSK